MGCNASKNQEVALAADSHNENKVQQPQQEPPPASAVTRNARITSYDLGRELQSMHSDFVENGELSGSVVPYHFALGTPIDEVYLGVRDGRVLGEGAFGLVRKLTHRVTGIEYAGKCIQLRMFASTEGYQQLRDEIWVMSMLDHPLIVRIAEVYYESFDEVFIVQELCHGGDLFDRLEDQLEESDLPGRAGLPFSEAQCAEYVKQMLAATGYLHSKNIVHRDIKLEHFMFSTPESPELRMIDFGLAKHLDASGYTSGLVGTNYTQAPEVLLPGGRYNEKFDIWSIGILTYLLLAGDVPFGSLDDPDSVKAANFREAIGHAPLVFEPTERWRLVSDEGKRFVTRLLNRDPAQRPSAAEAMEDPWIVDWARQEANQDRQLSPETLQSLMAFKESSEMQRLLSEVLSYTLLPEQISGLRDEFAKIDKTGSGLITLASLKQVLMLSAKESFWFLTEHDVEEIFDSIKMSRNEPAIRWHEFVAAGFSKAQYDDRNMRLAFERLDIEHNGFLTMDDLADVLMDRDGMLEGIWRKSIEDLKISSERITYEDFVAIMKGSGEPLAPPITEEARPGAGTVQLPTVAEETATSHEGYYSAKPEPRRARRHRSAPLPAHTGDEFDGLLKDSTNSPLIAKRTQYRMNREILLPAMAGLTDKSPIPGKKKRKKSTSCPASQAGLVLRHGHDSLEAKAFFDAGTARIGSVFGRSASL